MTQANKTVTKAALEHAHVPESAFGKWFLRTGVWTHRVLEIALQDLCELMSVKSAGQTPQFDVIVDVACGYGESLAKLNSRFSPKKLIAMDIDPEMLDEAVKKAERDKLDNVETVQCSNSKIALPDNSVDMLFCHQSFHHLIYMEEAMAEYFRVLKPGGVMLFAESTKRYIHSWVIKWLFRHPMKVQKTADEYLELIRGSGFSIDDAQISYPFLWWSREDLGIMENLFGRKPPVDREEPLVNLIAVKPV
jgi:ubiquinone/menaquinone biosynthesis C-methylase UbiE